MNKDINFLDKDYSHLDHASQLSIVNWIKDAINTLDVTESEEPNKRTRCCDYHQALSDLLLNLNNPQ